jgi:5-methylcytosine-specific restriction endonuclease McrA
MSESKYKVLKLNRNYFPIGIDTWERVMVGIFSGSLIPARVIMEGDEIAEFDSFKGVGHDEDPKNTINHWLSLNPKEGENFVQTSHNTIVIPSVVICARYDRIRHRRAIFPTKRNIWERDDYTCGYTGKRLKKDELSIDHIIPKSRGGMDTWDNLITCNRTLNSQKSNRTPEEHGLSLQWKPTKPTNGYIFDTIEDAWKKFVE